MADFLENISQKAEALEVVLKKIYMYIKSQIPVFVIGKVAGQFGIDLEAILESPDYVIEDIILENPVELIEDDILLASLSSGTTTGVPNIVLLSHGNFMSSTEILKK